MNDPTGSNIPRVPVTVANVVATKPATLTGTVGLLITFVLTGLRVFDVWVPTADQLEWVVAAPAALGVAMLTAARYGLISRARVNRYMTDEIADSH